MHACHQSHIPGRGDMASCIFARLCAIFVLMYMYYVDCMLLVLSTFHVLVAHTAVRCSVYYTKYSIYHTSVISHSTSYCYVNM